MKYRVILVRKKKQGRGTEEIDASPEGGHTKITTARRNVENIKEEWPEFVSINIIEEKTVKKGPRKGSRMERLVESVKPSKARGGRLVTSSGRLVRQRRGSII